MSQPALPTTPPATGGSWVHVADLKDVARRKRKQVVVSGCPIALFLVDDEVFAVDDTCIHQEKSLAKGTLLNGQVICPGHQWRFNPNLAHCAAQWPARRQLGGKIPNARGDEATTTCNAAHLRDRARPVGYEIHDESGCNDVEGVAGPWQRLCVCKPKLCSGACQARACLGELRLG